MSTENTVTEITKTLHSGYNQGQEKELRAYYQNTVLRTIVSATWSPKDKGWIVEHIPLGATYKPLPLMK